MKGKLVNRSLSFFPLLHPYHHFAGENGKRGIGCTTCFKRRDRINRSRRVLGRMGKSMFFFVA